MKDIQIKDKVKISFPTFFGTIKNEGEGFKTNEPEDGFCFYVKHNDIILDISIPLWQAAKHRDLQNAKALKQAEIMGASPDRYIVKDLIVQELIIDNYNCRVVMWWTDCYGTSRTYFIPAKICKGAKKYYLQTDIPEFYF